MAELHIVIRGTRRALLKLLRHKLRELIRGASKAYLVDDRIYSQDEIERWLHGG